MKRLNPLGMTSSVFQPAIFSFFFLQRPNRKSKSQYSKSVLCFKSIHQIFSKADPYQPTQNWANKLKSNQKLNRPKTGPTLKLDRPSLDQSKRTFTFSIFSLAQNYLSSEWFNFSITEYEPVKTVKYLCRISIHVFDVNESFFKSMHASSE